MRKLLSIILIVILMIIPVTALCEDISVRFDDYFYSMKVGKSVDILSLLEIKSPPEYELSYRFYSSDEDVAVIKDDRIYLVCVGNATVTAVVYFDDGRNIINKYATVDFRVKKDGNLTRTPDTNLDGVINSDDISMVLACYGREYDKCDFDGSGEVNNSDLSIILHRYGEKM